MGGEKAASKAWSACRDNGNSCTEPSCYMGTGHVYLCLSRCLCLILNRMCKRLRGRMSMESRWFAFQDRIHYKLKLKHFISSACRHRRGKKISWSFIVSVFTLPFSCCGQPQISMQWWMLFITKGWSGKWSKMRALGSCVWLEYIL